MPLPTGCHDVPFQRATWFTVMPEYVNCPPAISSPLNTVKARMGLHSVECPPRPFIACHEEPFHRYILPWRSPATSSPFQTAKAETKSNAGVPNEDHAVPFQRATWWAFTPPTVSKAPAA